MAVKRKPTGYSIEKCDDGSGYVIYPDDPLELAWNYGGPVDGCETYKEARAIVARLNAEKRAAPLPSADKGPK